jgi:hypothetical protein
MVPNPKTASSFVGMFIICLHTTFYIPNSSGLLFLAVKLKAEENFLFGSFVLLILQNNVFTEVVYFQNLYYHT